MSTTFEIPLSPQSQTFTISLAGVVYSMGLWWNEISNVWVLDIFDASVNPILRGVPLVANVDLLAAYPDKNFGGALIAQTDDAANVPPTFDNLGVTGHLYFTTP